MKMKKLLMALLLMSVIAISVSAVAAEQAQIGQNTFDVPDGYTIVQTEDNMIMMQIDENITFLFAGLYADARKLVDIVFFLKQNDSIGSCRSTKLSFFI